MSIYPEGQTCSDGCSVRDVIHNTPPALCTGGTGGRPGSCGTKFTCVPEGALEGKLDGNWNCV